MHRAVHSCLGLPTLHFLTEAARLPAVTAVSPVVVWSRSSTYAKRPTITQLGGETVLVSPGCAESGSHPLLSWQVVLLTTNCNRSGSIRPVLQWWQKLTPGEQESRCSCKAPGVLP